MGDIQIKHPHILKVQATHLETAFCEVLYWEVLLDDSKDLGMFSSIFCIILYLFSHSPPEAITFIPLTSVGSARV